MGWFGGFGVSRGFCVSSHWKRLKILVGSSCAACDGYPLRRNDYQNNSINIFSCNCPGAITGFSCRAPENNSPKKVSCMGPCPVRAPPVIAPGALTGFSCRAPENNSKIIFPACNHFESEGNHGLVLLTYNV